MKEKKFPFLSRLFETEALDDTVRQAAEGDFIRLADGYTQFELGGPVEGQVVVLIHGFSAPYFIWEKTFHALGEAGFRVLRYNLYGRGLSDRPRLPNDLALFQRQLLNLLDALELDQPVDLVTISMGAPIAASFAHHSPARVRRLVLIGPTGGQAIKLLQLIKSNASSEDSNIPDYVQNYLDPYQVQMRYRGFKRALISSFRCGMLGEFTQLYRQVGEYHRPVLLVWGEKDATVCAGDMQRVRACFPRAEYISIPDAEHLAHFDKPQKVHPLLIGFLRRPSAQ